MSKALIAGINQVATDKGLDREVIFSAIEIALVSAYKRNYGSVANVSSEVDRATGDMRVFAEREIVEEVMNPRTEITIDDARAFVPTAKMGDVIKVPTAPDEFGRIAAQTAKQVILQRIREAERDTVFENFAHHINELITAQVRSVDALSGAVTVLLEDRHEVLMLREEQIPSEKLRRGDFIKVYVVDVHKSTRGPVIRISRTHRNLLKRLMEQEIPEVRDGVVEIKSIAREPGARSKVAVIATKPDVDPVGSCVGQRGLRIQNIVNELAGEKIDVVQWGPDPVSFIPNALSPAKVNSVILDESGSIKTAIVIVPDRQLSLAIGKEGQNARLAAKLTGWRIDIKSETEAEAEGLDRLAMERSTRVGGRNEDLLARAERILQEERSSTAEDRLAAAARALDTMAPGIGEGAIDISGLSPARSTETSQSDEQDKWESAMAELVDLQPLSPLDEEGAPAVEEEAAAEFEALPPLEDLTTFDEEISVEMELEDVAPPPLITHADDLPEVITADMLRARRGKTFDIATEDFKIPEELLVGFDKDAELELDEDLDESDLAPRGKGKGKAAERGKAKKAPVAKKASSKKSKKWRPAVDDVDLEDYS